MNKPVEKGITYVAVNKLLSEGAGFALKNLDNAKDELEAIKMLLVAKEAKKEVFDDMKQIKLSRQIRSLTNMFVEFNEELQEEITNIEKKHLEGK